jgi:23S rRNA pseudouridine1911/1915/1917 synthase
LKQGIEIISTPHPPDEWEDLNSELHELRHATVGIAQHGVRLDIALVHSVPEFSRSYLQQLLEAGLVQVNARVVTKASHRVKVGDALAIELRPTPQSQAFIPQPMPLDIVYEDAHIVVLNKPAGLVVHPAPGNWSGTLLNGLLAYDRAFSLVPRAGIVHRLDKDTSGLMVVARTRLAMDYLVERIAAREVSRQYLAVAHQPWVGSTTCTVEAAIGRDPRNRLRMAVVDLSHQSGKPAKTDFILLGNADEGCLVRCVLHTGRTHQIRVHMASLGHPLVADTVYGGNIVPAMGRQALHAVRLALAHPVSLETMVFHAPLPADLAGLLQAWGLHYDEKTGSE